MAGFGGIVFELGPEVPDVNVDGTGVTGHLSIGPQFVAYGYPAQSPSGVSGKEREEIEFPVGQSDLLPVFSDGLGGGVYFQGSEGHEFAGFHKRTLPAQASPPQA